MPTESFDLMEITEITAEEFIRHAKMCEMMFKPVFDRLEEM